jgi:uncharacterized membrane protein SpoIIM required for sporulation
MKKSRFLNERRSAWHRFEELLIKAENPRVFRLTEQEVSEFSELFRSLCYDLATVRSRDWGSGLDRYLNDLVVRGHGTFYGSAPRRRGAIVRFLTVEFPRLLRENAAYFWVSLVLFAAPFATSWALVERNPSLASRVYPGSVLAQAEEMYSQDLSDEDRPQMESAMAGHYVYNNISIAFRCFALGIFLGVGTVYVLVFNGIALGTFAGYVIARGHGENFLSFVVSHGSFELTAIVISGAAGLILGHAILAPGRLSRSQSLRRRGLVAIQLVMGAGAMLAVAALIEAFWSPSSLPPQIKYIGGGVLWSVVAAYLTLAGREKKPEKELAHA